MDWGGCGSDGGVGGAVGVGRIVAGRLVTEITNYFGVLACFPHFCGGRVERM